MEIGDLVLYRGPACYLRGLEPMSVPDRRVFLEDAVTGERDRSPLDALEPGRRTRPPGSRGFDRVPWAMIGGGDEVMQEMVIYGVSFDLVGKQPIVLLKTADGNKFLPIWIGHPEAAAILMKLQGATTPRPMTHDLVTDMLSSSTPRSCGSR